MSRHGRGSPAPGTADRQERHDRGHDRATERLRGADVDDLAQRLAAMTAEVLADAVVDDDRVVDRVADDREQRGDRRERDFLAHEDVDAERDERVVDERDDAARREPQVEAERDVDHDEDDRVEDRLHGGVTELRARLRADPLHAQRAVRRLARRTPGRASSRSRRRDRRAAPRSGAPRGTRRRSRERTRAPVALSTRSISAGSFAPARRSVILSPPGETRVSRAPRARHAPRCSMRVDLRRRRAARPDARG